KVKGTLEPLLSTGAKRSSLVTGKFFAISSMGIYSSLCAVLGLFFLSLLLKSSGFMSFSATLWMLLIVGLTSAFLAAVGLLLSIISRNFRESSTYTTLLSVLMGLPSIFSFNLNPHTVTRNQLHVPFYNVVCVIKELIVGMIQLEHLLLVLFWLLVYIGVFLCMTIRAFYDEKVLFKQ
ncbi:MAG TPA: ABC transporter permease subunit, partial [Clostridiales bacterium]|nr:ABC transporter permease subunit [Clostridiales bacterium]